MGKVTYEFRPVLETSKPSGVMQQSLEFVVIYVVFEFGE